MGRRRRKSCVDYGGGNRFYIHGCHNKDNQRFKFNPATTTTSTTTSITTTTITTTTTLPNFVIHREEKFKTCFDVPGQNFKKDQQLQIWDCNDSPAQSFFYKEEE